MKNYDTSIDYGRHKIKVTLQSGEYKGHFFFEMSGNYKGIEVLGFGFEWEDGEFGGDCNLRYNEHYDTWECELVNENGDVLHIEENSRDMNELVVGIEIIDFQEEESLW